MPLKSSVKWFVLFYCPYKDLQQDLHTNLHTTVLYPCEGNVLVEFSVLVQSCM